MSQIIEGKVAFSNMTEHDVYRGKSTGKYSLTITLAPEAAEALEAQGVKLKDYEGTPQRKFSTKFPVTMVTQDDNVWSEEIPRGSVVRLLFKAQAGDDEFGTSTFLNRVRILEFADTEEVPEEF